jgi:hypothetical protein
MFAGPVRMCSQSNRSDSPEWFDHLTDEMLARHLGNHFDLGDVFHRLAFDGPPPRHADCRHGKLAPYDPLITALPDARSLAPMTRS